MSSSEEPITTPEYGRLRNFWNAKSGNTPSEPAPAATNGTNGNHCLTNGKQAPAPLKEVEQIPTNGHSVEEMADLTPAVLEFDQEIVGGNLAEFLRHAKSIGGEVAEHAAMVQKAFEAQRRFLAVATKHAKPSDAEFQKLLTDTANAINEIQQFREKRRSSPVFNHLSGVSESIPALAWVTIAPTPAPYIKEMNDAGQFYTNRVLKDFKDKPGHAEWARAWVATLTALQTYVRKTHTTGLVWGKQPYAGGAPGGPAPPPPPPPSFDMDFSNLQVSGGNDDKAALFAELNKGSDITKGLKKVTSEMQTHKNPNLRAGGTVTSTGGTANNVGGVRQAPVAKPPKFALDGKKWQIEYQTDNKDLKIEQVEMNQVVYMFACKNSTLQIKGKLNSVVVDSCVKTAIVFDSVVASVEFINCRDCQVQVMGTVPTLTIDKTDGLQMFLNKESLNVEIVSAKSSALNVMVPQPNGDYAEWAVPEQFKTVIGKSGLVTTATETAGV